MGANVRRHDLSLSLAVNPRLPRERKSRDVRMRSQDTMKKRPEKTPEKGKPMARKEAVTNLRQILVRRRDALRKALAGDLSSLRELRQQTSGDMLDAAIDTAQDEISSQLAEVESRELTHIEIALERMRDGNYGLCEGCGEGIP